LAYRTTFLRNDPSLVLDFVIVGLPPNPFHIATRNPDRITWTAEYPDDERRNPGEGDAPDPRPLLAADSRNHRNL
jgi:hypothetical protein